MNVDDRNGRLATLYTYTVQELKKEVAPDGSLKSSQALTYEVFHFGGKPHRRLIGRNGKPLPADEAHREKENLDRAAAAAARQSPSEKAKAESEAERKRASERERIKHVPDAFDFVLRGETIISGRAAWEIDATPRTGYNGKYASLLRNMKGRLWIDKENYTWVRFEAEALDTVSVGLILARLAKGSRFSLEQTWVNNEVWVPRRFTVDASARIALLKNMKINQETTYTGYRKFQSDSRVTSVHEIP